MTCAGCGAELTLLPYGRPRKWCSERCRRRTSYSGACIDCGKSTYSGEAIPSKRCVTCNVRRTNDLNQERNRQKRELIERLWAEGKTAREIAAVLGWTVKNPGCVLSVCRSHGYNLPYRRTPEQLARITAGAAERMAKARAKAAEMRAAA